MLAYRLGEDRDVSVLVLEAGGSDGDPLIHIPLGMGLMHARRSHDWGYDFEPEEATASREIEAMRGKVIGGSSAINHMSHVRGNPGDYDRWAASGLKDWSYAADLRTSAAAKPGPKEAMTVVVAKGRSLLFPPRLRTRYWRPLSKPVPPAVYPTMKIITGRNRTA